MKTKKRKGANRMWFAVAVVWASTAAAVCYGIHITHSAGCLWAMLIPAMISWKVGGKKDNSQD